MAHQQIKPFVSDKSQKVIGQDKTLGQEHQHKHIFYDSVGTDEPKVAKALA